MLRADIYIDTDIKGPRRRDGKYLYIIGIPEEGRYRQSRPQTGREENTTENRLTLEALADALGHLKKPFRLDIYMECPYVAGILESGQYKQWEKNGWNTAKGKPAADSGTWRRISELLGKHEFAIHLKTPHSYREWMRWTLK